MPASVLDQVMDLYGDLFRNLFTKPFSEEIPDRRRRNEMSRRVEALADAASQSTIRMLTNQRVSETDVARILHNLRPLSVVTNAEALAETRDTTQGLVDYLLPKLPGFQSVADGRQSGLYRATLSTILQSLLLIAPVLQEWRKLGFATTYELPDRVIRQLNDISEGMDEQSRMLHAARTEAADRDCELTYRDYLAQRFYQIEAGTLRITTNLAVDIQELFVMPLVLERPKRPQYMEGIDANELMRLEQARERFGPRERTIPAETGSASEDGAKPPLTALQQVKAHPRNFLIGAPGSGKSTFFEWLRLTTAFPEVKGTNPEAIFLDTREVAQVIPLLLRVRQLNADFLPNVHQLVESAIASQDVAALMPAGWMQRQMTQGRILFMLDGVDEIAPEKRDTQLFPWLKAIVESYPDCRYLLSSRPTGYPAGAFNALGFEECDLLEFDEERIRAYTTNWHTAIRLAHNEPKDEARTKGEEDAKRVIASFETNPYIQDLARNPLMLSAICLVYEFEGGRLPEDRAKLYQLCVEGLLHNWDERRRIRSPFPFSEKLRACREVAITMQSQSFAELDAPKVKEVFTAVLQDAGEAEALLAHLRHRASLLVERRPDVFAFGHLTFQEYLAARAVHEGNIEGVTIQRLAEDHADGRWREVIPLYTGLATSLNARQMLEELLVQKDTEALCNILLDALSSAAVEIRQDAELRRRVLKRALTAPGRVNTPTMLPQDEIYAMALECVGTSDYNERLSAAFSVLYTSLVSADTSHLFKRLQNWRLMISTQITELIYLIHRYGDDDILRNVAGDRELYLSELPELGIQLAMAVEIERKTLPVLAAQPEVAAILPNQRIQLIRPTNVAMKNLSSFEKQLGMTWGLRTLGIPTLWEVTKNKGQGVRVAVLDTGVDAEHPVLSGRVNAFSLIDPLGQRIAATPYFDGSNHGTHVCGTIAGQATEDGVQIGLAPECELLVGAILVGEATVHTFIEGVSWALDHGADIINMSFGTTYYEPRFESLIQLIREVDVLPVVAIGNEQFGNSRTPGSSRYSLSVGAVGEPWQKPIEVAHFSSGVSFTFPGNPTEYLTKPDVVAPGVEVYSCVPRRKDQAGTLQPAYAYMDGTSMATPHVTGVAVLLMAAKPSAPVDTIIEVLKATADHPNGAQLRPDNRWGYGIINGVNAYKAL